MGDGESCRAPCLEAARANNRNQTIRIDGLKISSEVPKGAFEK